MRVAGSFGVAFVLCAGCSAGGGSTLDGEAKGAGGAAAGTGSGGESTASLGVGGAGTGGAGTGGENVVAEVYAHSATVLYRLDPVTLDVTVVGTFNGCSSVIDIAIDKASALVATTFDGVYAVDKYTAKCTPISSGSYPNSLSYVPEGALDPGAEVLVGFNGASYVRIDPASGQVQTVGQIGGAYASSGDVVSVKGGSTFLTVKSAGCGDCLIEVDPSKGTLVKEWGPLGYDDVFGLAFWGGTAYGFTNGGQAFRIDFSGGQLKTQPIPLGSAQTTGLSFWGAGSSTHAPVDVPK
jgi:hypothetical protein